MAEISAALVKELRDAHGRGDDGLQARARRRRTATWKPRSSCCARRAWRRRAKRAGRETTEGLVGYRLADDGSKGTMVAVGCETEPVSKNDEFQAFAKKVLDTVDAKGVDAAAELDDERTELAAKLGENIVVAGAARFEAVDGGLVAAYAHPPANKLGVLLQLRGGDAELGRKVAMHIAASNPQWIDRDDVPADAVAAGARDLRELRRGAVEAGAGAREDRRGHARTSASSARTCSLDQEWIHDSVEDRRAGAEGGRRRSARVPALLARRMTRREPEETAAHAPEAGAPGFRRVLLKLSGEALMGDARLRDRRPGVRRALARGDRRACTTSGVEIAIVVGGGNFYRGLAAAAEGMERATADYAGMLATLLNALALQDVLERQGADTRVQSALEVERGRRAVHPAPGDPPPREGPHRHLRRRHRQPVLHDRHGRGAARARDRRRRDPDGEARRRGRLRRRPADRPERAVPAAPHASRGDRARAEGHGHDRALALHGQQAHDSRVRARRRQHRAASSPASTSARSSRPRRRARAMATVDELIRQRADADGQVRRACAQRVQHRAHRPRVRGAARPHRRRLLRHDDAAEAARDDRRARGAHAHDSAVRPELDPEHREGDHGVRSRPHAVERRQDDPPADPAADRGAPQGARQGRARPCRGAPRRRARDPARRDEAPEGARRQGRRRRRRGASRRGAACRSSPTTTRSRSTTC